MFKVRIDLIRSIIFAFMATKINHDKYHQDNQKKVNLEFPNYSRNIRVIEDFKLLKMHWLKARDNRVISELSRDKIK